MGGVILIIGSIATSFVAVTTWDQLETGVLLVDLAVLAAMWGIALTSDRFWPYWVTAWQLIAVLVHLQMVIFANILPSAYGYVTMYLAFPMVLLMLAAAVRHRIAMWNGRGSTG
ncbi:MAG: hypothetical protein K2X31_06400 [Sphingopyxis sp.]|nr:hypothetical protein [Sphingopyxis sp.]